MERNPSAYSLCAAAIMIALIALISCHAPKSLGKPDRSPGKGKPAAKDSSAVKIDDSPSEFF